MEQSNTALATADQTIIVDELVTDSRFDTLPLSFIRISKTNRKRFNEAALKELAANIKANGLIQPILVRPVEPTEDEPEAFEIVCGERRYRASIIAELLSINVLIRNLSDTQAAELQLIENLQREDPHPMEEAEGYQALMLHSGYTTDMLADKLSKSKSQIYATLKLCNLCKELRDEFFNNKKFNRSLALLVARIPVPALQVEAFNEIIDESGDGEPMSYRDAAEHIQAHYNVHLKTAIFSTTDTRLVLDAGSCRSCSKRSGNDPDLVDLDKNICTDPKCYEQKSIAHNAQLIAKAEQKNIPVLYAAEANKAFIDAEYKQNNYAKAATRLFRFNRLINKDDNNKTIVDAIGSDKMPEPIAIAVINNVPVNIYNALHIQITLEDLGFCEKESKARAKAIEKELENNASGAGGSTEQTESSETTNDNHSSEGGTTTEALDQSAKKSEKIRALANEEIKRIRIYKAIRQRGQLSLESLRAFMKHVDVGLYFSIPESVHEEFYGRNILAEEDRLEYIDQASSEQLQLLLIDYVIGDIQIPRPWHLQDTYLDRSDDEFNLLQTVAQHEGIDIAIAEQEPASPVQAPATEQTEPEATPAPKKRGRKSNAEKAALAAQEAASKPAPVEKWPFPTPKKESAES